MSCVNLMARAQSSRAPTTSQCHPPSTANRAPDASETRSPTMTGAPHLPTHLQMPKGASRDGSLPHTHAMQPALDRRPISHATRSRPPQTNKRKKDKDPEQTKTASYRYKAVPG